LFYNNHLNLEAMENQDPKKDGNKKETDPNNPTANQDKERRQEVVTDSSKTNKDTRKTEEPEVWIKKEETPNEAPKAKQWDTTAGNE
jgi:hypothetical protein